MKAEDKFTNAIRKVTEDEYERISEYILHVFFAGFVCGIMFALSSLAPLSIGVVGGYVLAKKNFTAVNLSVLKLTAFLTKKWENVKKNDESN